jgi:hypothetical protein
VIGTYYLQAVAVRVDSNIIARIAIRHVRHDKERFVIKLIGTEEFLHERERSLTPNSK